MCVTFWTLSENIFSFPILASKNAAVLHGTQIAFTSDVDICLIPDTNEVEEATRFSTERIGFLSADVRD